MNRLKNFYKRHAYIYTVIIVLVVIGVIAFINNAKSNANTNTVTVHPQNFAEQLAVTGTVTATQNVNLNFAQGGRITSVKAKVGEQISAGTILAEVENADLEAALQQKQAALQTAQANFRTTQSGTRPEQLAVNQSQVTSDQTALLVAKQARVNTLTSAYASLQNVISSDIDQLYDSPTTNPSFGVTINGSNNTTYSISGGTLEYTVNSERVQLSKMINKLNSLDQTLSADKSDATISAASDLSIQTLQATQKLLSDLSTILAGYTSQDTSAQAIYTNFKTALATAGTSVSSSISSINSAVTVQSASQAALDKDQKSLTLAEAGSTQNDIDAASANVKAAQADVANAQAQVAKTIITAPFDGTVTTVTAKVGQTADSNTAEISLDSNGVFQIDSYVPEVYVSNLNVGNTATTTLDAYGATVFFPVKVVSIDPAQTVVNGVSNYKTTLQFLAADPRIKAGMTANININTANVPNAFVIPRGAVFTKNGQQYVQVLEGKKAVDVSVVTGGSSSIGEVQITSGLRDGDSVLLDPKTS